MRELQRLLNAAGDSIKADGDFGEQNQGGGQGLPEAHGADGGRRLRKQDLGGSGWTDRAGGGHRRNGGYRPWTIILCAISKRGCAGRMLRRCSSYLPQGATARARRTGSLGARRGRRSRPRRKRYASRWTGGGQEHDYGVGRRMGIVPQK